MHIGSADQKSKTEAIYFLPSIKELENTTLSHQIYCWTMETTISISQNPSNTWVHTSPQIIEMEIQAEIKKGNAQMWMLKDFFMCKEVDKRIKYWIYIEGPLNSLLWRSESWSITDKTLRKVHAFHNTSIRKILEIRMDKVWECHITNKQIRHWFINTTPIDDFIARRTWWYICKAYHMSKEYLPKEFLSAWIHTQRKQEDHKLCVYIISSTPLTEDI